MAKRTIAGAIFWKESNIVPGKTPVSYQHIAEIDEYITKLRGELDGHQTEASVSAHPIVTSSAAGFVSPNILLKMDAISARINSLRNAVNTVIPNGIVLPYYGKPSAPPSYWVWCNGNNGTFNSKNRYILGAASSSTSASYPIHSSSDTVVNIVKAITINNLPAHSHSFSDFFFSEHPSLPNNGAWCYNSPPSALGCNEHDYDNSLAYFHDTTDYVGTDTASTGTTYDIWPRSMKLPFLMYNYTE